MHPGMMICLERDRLLANAATGANTRQRAIEKLTKIGGLHESKEFARLTAELQELSTTALTAWDEYRKHLKEHGC